MFTIASSILTALYLILTPVNPIIEIKKKSSYLPPIELSTIDNEESTMNEAGNILIPIQEGAITKDHIKGTLHELITKKRDYNKKNGFGYRIQLYYGNEVKAKSTIGKFKYMFPGVYAKLVYDNPEWKAHVGNYKTKLEADKDLLLFKENFSGIIVIPMGK